MQGDVFPEIVPARAGAIAENRLFANNAGRGIPRKGRTADWYGHGRERRRPACRQGIYAEIAYR